MKNLKLILGLILLLTTVQAVTAQEQLTLKQAQDYAIQNSYEIKTALLDLELAEEKIKETTAIGLPQINGEVAFQNFIEIPTVIIPDFTAPPNSGATTSAQFGTNYVLNGTLTASQLIFDGSYLIGLQATKAYKSLSEVAVEKSEQDIKQIITDSYSLCLSASESLRIQEESLAVLEKNLKETKALYENGFVEEQDVEQLELSVKNLSNEIKNAEFQELYTLSLLKFRLGLAQSTEIELTSTIEELVSNSVSSGLLDADFKLENNLDYQLALTNQNLMDLDVRNKKSAFLPSLAGYFQYQQAAQRNELKLFSGDEPWFPTSVWGLNLNVPIFSSGQRRSRVQQARIELERAENRVAQAKEGAQLEITTARNNMIYAIDNYQTSIETRELSKRIYDKTQIKYNEGISSSSELIQVKNQYLETQGKYVEAVVNLLLSSNALNKALNNY